ncbi:putative reverse transcriptase domain-containing protein [Tanacetum coccineum]
MAQCTLQDECFDLGGNSHKRTIVLMLHMPLTNWAGLKRMVPDEEDRVERFIGGLPDNIQGNVIAANPVRLQDANVARAYTAGNNERKGYVGFLPYCNKCRLHHEGLCTIRCGNCKKVGHLTRDCRVTVTPNTQGALIGNHSIGCYDMWYTGTFQGRIFLRLEEVRNHGNQQETKKKQDWETRLISTIIIGNGLVGEVTRLIVCDEKVIRIPYRDEVLIIQGDNCDSGSKLNVISCTRTQKFIEKGCQVYLSQVTSKKADDKSAEKRLEDVSIVREFLKVFLEDLPGLPPAR